MFDQATFEDDGKALLISILDLANKNPISRVFSTPFGNLRQLKLFTACYLI